MANDTQGAVVMNDTSQGKAVTTQRASALAPHPGGSVVPFDPFALMDRLDATAFIEEMQGIASDVLVYTIKDGGKETVALSKAGIDECCTMLVGQGQCIREHDLKFEFIGDDEEREAIFQCYASRFAVDGSGREVKLDSVIGVKREPLYERRAPLSLDSKVPGKKWRGWTYRAALNDDEARGYLEWIVSGSSFDPETKAFVQAVLNGEDVEEWAVGKRLNNFWYEHGAMKAARNARMRLIPAGLKAQVLASAKQAGKVQTVSRDGEASGAPEQDDARAPDQQRSSSTRTSSRQQNAPAAAASPDANWTNGKAMVFPYDPLRRLGVTLDAVYNDGATRTRKRKGQPDEVIECSGQLVVSNARISEALDWIDGKFARHAALLDEGKDSGKDWLTDEDVERLTLWREDIAEERERRKALGTWSDEQSQSPTRSSATSDAQPSTASTGAATAVNTSAATNATSGAASTSADAHSTAGSSDEKTESSTRSGKDSGKHSAKNTDDDLPF